MGLPARPRGRCRRKSRSMAWVCTSWMRMALAEGRAGVGALQLPSPVGTGIGGRQRLRPQASPLPPPPGGRSGGPTFRGQFEAENNHFWHFAPKQIGKKKQVNQRHWEIATQPNPLTPLGGRASGRPTPPPARGGSSFENSCPAGWFSKKEADTWNGGGVPAAARAQPRWQTVPGDSTHRRTSPPTHPPAPPWGSCWSAACGPCTTRPARCPRPSGPPSGCGTAGGGATQAGNAGLQGWFGSVEEEDEGPDCRR